MRGVKEFILCFVPDALMLAPLMRKMPATALALGLIACAALGSQTEFLAGRRALLRGEPDNALASFDRVAEADPAYVSDNVSPRRSIWTYVGRAHYNAGRYPEARAAFEKAFFYLKDDHIARLYLGLTLLRPPAARAAANAFNLQEIIFALREGVAPKRVATLARERGVAFDLSKETESQLRAVGADSSLLNELKHIRAEGSKPNQASDEQRKRAAKELTAALNGLREWLDYTVAYTPQGKFWDPGGEIRRQIQLSLKQLEAQPSNWDAVVSNAETVGFQIEEENDRARRDESAERDRQLRR